MDIVFYCSKCNQEFSVDETAAGEQIQCPTCSEFLIIPEESAPRPVPAGQAVEALQEAEAAPEPQPAHEERHFAVPVHDGPAASLVQRQAHAEEDPNAPHVKVIRTHCIKHYTCVEVGHDRYDEVVTSFLQKIGEENI